MRLAVALLALAGLSTAAPAPDTDGQLITLGERDLEPRQSVVGSWRYCSPETGLCYNSYETIGKGIYRIALPDNASGGNYDIALQLVAPRNYGWTALSFGGSMINAPIVMAWPNGGTCEVSSRWSTCVSIHPKLPSPPP